ncbi:MAG TPA: ABC transporter permease [Fimbriimonas sp.]|nr:ABC transporter permease [Fimbriimonas sp.]
MLQLFLQLVKKDLLIFFADKKAMIITLAVPIGIASFLGSVMGGASDGKLPNKVTVMVSDQDGSATTKAMIQKLRESNTVSVKEGAAQIAEEKVKSGDVAVAIILPRGFGASSSAAMQGGEAPSLPVISDPSKSVEAQVAKGAIMQSVTSVLVKNIYGRAEVLPFKIEEKTQTNTDTAKWSGSAHAFAGMGIQALFFGALEAAMLMMRDRRNGIWSRLRASPVSRWTLLFARLTGSAILSTLTYCIVFASGMAIFGFRINGSIVGFGLIALTLGAMVAATGLFIAALGKTEQQSRGLSILVILSMLLLGGAWFPAFLMPSWIQPVSYLTPVRWAVDGVDAMTWRGEGLAQAIPAAGVLAAFALVLTLVAGARFRWEPEAK